MFLSLRRLAHLSAVSSSRDAQAEMARSNSSSRGHYPQSSSTSLGAVMSARDLIGVLEQKIRWIFTHFCRMVTSVMAVWPAWRVSY
jgi:hypothetical protein